MNILTPEEKRIIENKGTEIPFTGIYDNFLEAGTFICRKCNAPLFSSKDKFDAQCGWPAFSSNFPNAIKKISDPDGTRTEIVCANCNAHLGHVFEGENLSETNIRHCVNSVSLHFIPQGKELPPPFV
jgi:peptide-methionine (R)-S-oxide reductase